MIAIYVVTWILTSGFLGLEYWNLTHKPQASLLLMLQHRGLISHNVVINTEPGRPLSLWLGWIGLGLMILMNLYSIRKRASWMRGSGSLKSWLNFHVYCGILGPTLILFHSGFHVRGIVAISFWSMVISLSSGIIGRYFYVQLLTQRKDLETFGERILGKFDGLLQKQGLTVDPKERAFYITSALRLVGVPDDRKTPNALVALVRSLFGDMRLMFGQVAVAPGWPSSASPLLSAYAVNQRKCIFLGSFQNLMGYWHAFHFPFAIFMYVAAVIHVAAALVLGV